MKNEIFHRCSALRYTKNVPQGDKRKKQLILKKKQFLFETIQTYVGSCLCTRLGRKSLTIVSNDCEQRKSLKFLLRA